MPDFAVTTAFRGSGNIIPYFGRMTNAADRFGRRGSRAMAMVSNAARSMMPLFGFAMIARTANRAINLASDLVEVQNVVNISFRENEDQINSWSRTALRAYGLSELQAKEFAGTLGSMMQSAGLAGQELVTMSTRLSGLAGDIASVRNIPVEDAFNAIRSGIVGVSQPLRNLGVDMSVANLEAFALTQGITKQYRAMSQAERIQLRYNFIMRATTSMQGDFNRTLATSYANQKRVLGVQFDQFLARVATGILPALTDGFASLNRILEGIDTKTLSDGLKIIVGLLPYLIGGFVAYKVALMAAAAWQAAIVAAGWVSYLASMIPVMRASIAAQGLYNFLLKGTAVAQTLLAIKTGIWTAAQWLLNAAFLAFPLTWIIIGILAIIAVGIYLYRNFDTIKERFLAFWETSKQGWMIILNAFRRAKTFIMEGLQSLKNAILGALMSPINSVVSGIISLLQLASRLPGVGARFARAAQQAQRFQARINEFAGTENPNAPNEAAAGAQRVNLSGEINVNNAPAGTTAEARTTGANPININVTGEN